MPIIRISASSCMPSNSLSLASSLFDPTEPETGRKEHASHHILYDRHQEMSDSVCVAHEVRAAYMI